MSAYADNRQPQYKDVQSLHLSNSEAGDPDRVESGPRATGAGIARGGERQPPAQSRDHTRVLDMTSGAEGTEVPK